jgi:hypothetical protein
MITLIKGFLKSKTAWKDFLLFALPALMAYVPSQDEMIRQAIGAFIANNPWVGFVIFFGGLYVRFLTTRPVTEK